MRTNEIVQVISTAVEKDPRSPKALSLEASKSPKLVSRLTNEGKLPEVANLTGLCDALGLEFYIGPPRESSDSAVVAQITRDKRNMVGGRDTGLVSLPRYDIEASAGHGALARDHAVFDYLTVPREWLSRYVSAKAQVVVIEARGDSMEPTVRHGDLLIVEMAVDNDTVAAGGVFILSVAGMIMIKRLQIMLNSDLKILSDNTAYESETVPADERDDKVIIHGRVVWSGGPMGGRR